MAELDFSDLSDDQIVELAVGLAREAMRRNPALSAAFEKALVAEHERVQAAARGSARAKTEALAQIEAQAQRARAEVHRAEREARTAAALKIYLLRGADLARRAAEDVTLVWKMQTYTGDGPILMLNAGTAGADASWHLIKYNVKKGTLHLSPAMRKHAAAAQAWADEAVAAIRALRLTTHTVIKGIQL